MKKLLITTLSVLALTTLFGWLGSIADHYNRIVLDAPKHVKVEWPDGTIWIFSDNTKQARVSFYPVSDGLGDIPQD